MQHFIISSNLLLKWLLLVLGLLGGQISSGSNDQNIAVDEIAISSTSLSPSLRNMNSHINNNNSNNNTKTALPGPSPASPPPMTTNHPTPNKGVTHKPTEKVTHEPTKKYIPEPPDSDNNDGNEPDKKMKNTGLIIFTWLLFFIAISFLIYIFRNSIAFFFLSAYTNTRRYGCKGFLYSFFPCFYNSGMDGGRGLHQPLDQIIFETDESSYTRSNLREGLM